MQIYLYSIQTTDPEQIDDSSDGKGGMVTYTLKNLESSASYAIYMIAKNSKGTTSKSNTISFTTQGMCINKPAYILKPAAIALKIRTLGISILKGQDENDDLCYFGTCVCTRY